MDKGGDIAECGALAARFSGVRGADNLIVAVSGGSDSLALLYLLFAWWDKLERPRPRLVVASIDHALRPESASECRAVRAHALAMGLEHRILTWHGDKPAAGLQEAARLARYRLLAACADRLAGRSLILTAHTLDDQAETVLMRLARGSGVDGLAAIPRQGRIEGGVVERPLLDLRRADLRAYLEGRGISWLDDPSNAAAHFERTRVREAGPQRAALGLNDAALARTAGRMARARRALEGAVEAVLAPVVATDDLLARFGIFSWRSNYRELADEIQIRMLRRIVRVLGGQAGEPELGQVEALFERLQGPGFGGATLHGCRIEVVRGASGQSIRFYRECGRTELPAVVMPQQGGVLWDRRFWIAKTVNDGKDLRVTGCDMAAIAVLRSDPEWRRPEGMGNACLHGLPAIWEGGSLYAVPALEWPRGGRDVSAVFQAERLLRRGVP